MLDTDVLVKTKEVRLNDNIISELKERYIAFDVETTGFNNVNDRIIELGAVLFEKGKPVKRFGSLVNANISISPEVTKINHIDNEMISSAPGELEVYDEFIAFMGDAIKGNTIICAHNANFDMGFLRETFKRLGISSDIRFIDTLDISRRHVWRVENHKQGTLASYFGIVNECAHRAESDAVVCGKILWKLIDIVESK